MHVVFMMVRAISKLVSEICICLRINNLSNILVSVFKILLTH